MIEKTNFLPISGIEIEPDKNAGDRVQEQTDDTKKFEELEKELKEKVRFMEILSKFEHLQNFLFCPGFQQLLQTSKIYTPIRLQTIFRQL